MENSEVDVGLIFDGMNSFSELECIIVRFKTKDLRIYDLVVRVVIFQDSLNVDEIFNHIIDTIQNKPGIQIENWIASMCNCAATNRAYIGRVRVYSTKEKLDLQILHNSHPEEYG